jgi:hypothetical protein
MKKEPINKEISEMADLEKSIEMRAANLLKDQAIKLPLDDVNSPPLAQNSNSNKSEDDTDEIDWDKVGSNLWGDKEDDFTPVKERNNPKGELRRSIRNLGVNMKIQEKAEATKKKTMKFQVKFLLLPF